jgi:hypothetical protein
MPTPLPFTPPFRNDGGTIRDAAGREVRLWGVNYYAPFAHNYINIQQLGRDHCACIDQDIAHFQRLGLDFVRIHLYEREITDRHGNLVENDQMRVFDHLVKRLGEAGIFLMVTPITWWSSPVFQAQLDANYAYWHAGSEPAFGFSNFFGKDALLWHPEALECQERYLSQLFARRSTADGRRLGDCEHLVALEIINEPTYLGREMLAPDAQRGSHMWDKVLSAPEDRGPLRAQWQAFSRAAGADGKEAFDDFTAQLLSAYLRRMYGAIAPHLARPVLKTHINYYEWRAEEPAMRQALVDNGIDAMTLGLYLNGPGDFDSSSTEHLNYLQMLSGRFSPAQLERLRVGGLGRIVYEYDATGTLRGYPFAAMAKAFSHLGVQMAAMFTYTPAAVAEYNPGWLVHYLNYHHTPRKAAALAAAGNLFRGEPLGSPLPAGTATWSGGGWEIDGERDRVAVRSGTTLIHAGDVEAGSPALAGAPPEVIQGVGANPYAASASNGIWRLRRLAAGELELELEPGQRTVADPLRGRAFRPMANRYMDVNAVPPVSRLVEGEWRFRLSYPGFAAFTCRRAGPDGIGQEVAVQDGSFSVRAGIYRITAPA